MLEGTEHLLVTATWTVVEVTSALVRAARGRRAADLRALLALHLAVAELAAVPLLDPGASLGLASRGAQQSAAGRALGYVVV